ncbi:hypothetical protein KJ966_29655 [bacterium]|nr:hypothetical protein [bacterium]
MQEPTHLPAKMLENPPIPASMKPIESVLIIGHGDIAVRQSPTYQHWFKEGVEVHCADVEASKLDDCIGRAFKYILPDEKQKLAAFGANYFDLLLVNNVPELHLATALEFSPFAKQIVIQKPQDLNFPFIRTIATAKGFEDFRSKAKIFDHYRNKGAVPALLSVLPMLNTDYGQFRRLMFFLTESKSVNDEIDRVGSLECGMIQDLGVHLLDLFLECISVGVKWRDNSQSDQWHQRVGIELKIVACPKYRMQNSHLGDKVETFAALDIEVTEHIEFPVGSKHAKIRHHTFDTLIVVGKGLTIEQGVKGDLKVVVAEYERNGYNAQIDLTTQGTLGIDPYLPLGGQEINRHHGGLNRPLLLISPNPPEHALTGLGGIDYQQWQDLTFAQYVATYVEEASRLQNGTYMDAYPFQRPLGDQIRELAAKGKVRSRWGDLKPLTGYLSNAVRPGLYML